MQRSGGLNGGRQAAALLVAAGLFTIVNNYLPGNENLDIGLLNLIAVLAVGVGVASWFVPWDDLPPYATLIEVPLALGLITTANYLGGVSSYSYAVYFVVLFVWVGLAHPPWTAFWLMLPAAAAYIWPLLLLDDEAPGGVASVSVAMPVCVLVAETIARITRRQQVARADALRREELSSRLVDVVAEVNAVLDPERVLPTLCVGVQTLLHTEASAYIRAEEGMATVVAVAGMPEDVFLGASYDVDNASMAEILRTATTVVVRDLDRYPDMVDELRSSVPGLHTLVAVPVMLAGQVHGALYAATGETRPPLSLAEIDALNVLAGHVAAALRNAATHAEVVRHQEHEQAVIDGMADGLAVVGRDGLVRSWNTAAERLTGIAATDAIDKPLPYEVGFTAVQHKLPGDRWIELLASPLADGELVVGIRDVSQAKALEEAKDLFLATTSHELRTPLTVIKGFTATLQNRWADLPDATRAESLRTVSERTESLIELVDHLLLGARADASKHSMRAEPLDIANIVDRAVSDVDAVTSRHTITLQCAPGTPRALADSTAVDHVVGQLLENAVKYSPEGGPIDVTLRPEAEWVVLAVADRGVGIAPGSETTIFDRFVQGQTGDSRAFGGVGLGLHIVRTLVEAMRGSVRASARDGGGAVFEILLPALAADAMPVPETAAERAG